MEFNRAQSKIINNKPNGHMLIKGVAGTGKTTAFINKIPTLLNKYCISKDDKLLIATNNEEVLKNVSFIYENIADEKYHQNSFFDEDNSYKLEMSTVDSLMIYYFNQYNKSNKKKVAIASITECKNTLEEAIKIIAKKYENNKINILNIAFIEFIQEEIKWIKSCDYINIEEYKTANRPYRVSNSSNNVPKILRKNSKQRQVVFEILVEYNNNLKKVNKIDHKDMELIALEEAQKNPSKNYTHIFIDSCQDLTKVQIDFLKALYNEKTYSSITFVIDMMQYNNPYAYLTKGRSFATLGYDMKGKSISLKAIFIEEEAKMNKIKTSDKIEQAQAENNIKDNLDKSALTLDTIEYIDLKRNVSHKFIKDSGSVDEIYIEYNGTEEKVEDVLSIPVFNEIAAGSPILMNDSIEDNYYLPKEWIRKSKDVFMLKVKGDSMINKNIYDGDYVVISKQNTPNVRDIVAVDIEGEATLKTYRIMDGKIALMPENEMYEPIIIEDQQFCFLGVAIGLIKNP
ncbi:LexA repressor [Clostridium gelidum]|uniref:LexA repressor n=1 Tax=Clostridium gelidum TaxID=704125 RepID=A0ABM7T6S3_9CLOT|nr:transcriptional repressor LexA [Clostridium gelidum]BCZ46673.1 LexA repressor [Clostridium gelidum]